MQYKEPYSTPVFERGTGGPIIVCGSAEGMFDDLRRARDWFHRTEEHGRELDYDALPVIAVNKAIPAIACTHAYSNHANFLGQWIDEHRDNFQRVPVIHGQTHPERHRLARRQSQFPFVDYWWHITGTSGSSGWAARKIAGLMGYAPVILCGIPVHQAQYYDGRLANDWQDRRIVERYRKGIIKDKEFGWWEGVYSMSGWTRDQFAEPPQ